MIIGEMGSELTKEINLAAKLCSVCDKQRKEIDVTLSAPIFYQFGKLYRKRSPDKISLIQSAAFFNAALARHPSYHKAKRDLEELCSHTLKLAGIEQPQKNVIGNISLKIQRKIMEMRTETTTQLEKLDIIPVGLSMSKLSKLKTHKTISIRKLQTKITKRFIDVMESASSQCIKLLEKPPCQYAVVGMGSLARQEITPYSDFEHVIVLEEGVQHHLNYQNILEYFRWFTVLFQIIIINLKETIIPSVSTPFLNNQNLPQGDWFFDCHTTRGISFDGMMIHACKFPLGRTRQSTSKPFNTELIKPVSEMAKFLQLEEDIKNGYHLADILTRTCLVSGSKDVYKKFERLAKRVLDCNVKENVQLVRSQLEDDLKTYDISETIFRLGTSSKWNIKRVIYRSTTLFVSALGRLHKIEKCSCFQIIDELQARKEIDKEVAQRLSFAIAVACETRLKVYLLKHSQDDYVGNRRFYTNDNKVIQQLCTLIGEESLGEYFVTARQLQLFFSKITSIKNGLYFRSSVLNRLKLFFMLDLHNLIQTEWQKYRQDRDLNVHTGICFRVACSFIKNGKFTEALAICSSLEEIFDVMPLTTCIEIMRRKAHCLCELERHEVGLRYIQKCMSKINSNFSWKVNLHAIGYLRALQGDCERHLGFFREATDSYSFALVTTISSQSQYRGNLRAKCWYFKGQCLLNLGELRKSLESTEQALEICEGSHIEMSLEYKCNRLLGECHLRLGQPQQALFYFEKELRLHSRFITNTEDTFDSDIAILLARIQEATEKLKL